MKEFLLVHLLIVPLMLILLQNLQTQYLDDCSLIQNLVNATLASTT